MGSKTGAREITKTALVELSTEYLDLFEAAEQLKQRAEAKEAAFDKLVEGTKYSACEIVHAAYRKPINQEKIDALLNAHL